MRRFQDLLFSRALCQEFPNLSVTPQIQPSPQGLGLPLFSSSNIRVAALAGPTKPVDAQTSPEYALGTICSLLQPAVATFPADSSQE